MLILSYVLFSNSAVQCKVNIIVKVSIAKRIVLLNKFNKKRNKIFLQNHKLVLLIYIHHHTCGFSIITSYIELLSDDIVFVLQQKNYYTQTMPKYDRFIKDENQVLVPFDHHYAIKIPRAVWRILNRQKKFLVNTMKIVLHPSWLSLYLEHGRIIPHRAKSHLSQKRKLPKELRHVILSNPLRL